jgi:Leucine-rich repeat (LRR) protein
MSGNQMDTTCSAIVNQGSLNVSIQNLQTLDLTGIRYFDNLQVFGIYSNADTLTLGPKLPPNIQEFNISVGTNNFSIPPFPSTLKKLFCNGLGSVTIPSFVNGMTEITIVQSWVTTIPALPSTLKKLTVNNNPFFNSLPALNAGLQYLDCSFNNLHILPNIPNSLLELDCRNNYLVHLPAIGNVGIQLQKINCQYNSLLNLGIMPNTLTYLDADHNQITNMSTSVSTSLQTFICSNNLLSGSSIPNLPSSISNFNCSNNPLMIFPNLTQFTGTINCSYGQISGVVNLPPSITGIDCSHNQISGFSSMPQSLGYLNCSYNLVSSFPNIPSNLTYLDCSYNLLTNLPDLPETSLSNLNCSYNQIQSIPPVPTQMTSFYINNNDVHCIAILPTVAVNNYGNISNNPLTCVPNITNYSGTKPLCIEGNNSNNPYICPIYANIAGKIYFDLDSDCTIDNTDSLNSNLPVSLSTSSNIWLQTSYTVNGKYSFSSLPAGTYKLNLNPFNLPTVSFCNQSNIKYITLTSFAPRSLANNLALICTPAIPNIKTKSIIQTGMVFPGLTHKLNVLLDGLRYSGQPNCTNLPVFGGTVTLTLTGPVTIDSYTDGSLTPLVNGNVVTYTITNFNDMPYFPIKLKLKTDTTATANDMVCVHVSIQPNQADADTTDNEYDYCYAIFNSYDPNEKEVFPKDVPPGYVDWLTYTIHFQNTGNAPAFNIKLKDTLDTNLDLSTFEFRDASHAASTNLNGRVLTVRFNNIMLPDSSSDHEGSMGYFQYRIKPKPNMADGIKVKNKAHIFFDYNAAIITNTTENLFTCISNVQQSFTICNGDSVQVGNHWYDESGTYSDTLQNVLNCDSIITTTVNEIIIDTVLSLNGITIQAVAGYLNYQWKICLDNSIISGSNTNNFTPTVSGNYAVTIAAQNACTATSSCETVCLPSNTQQSFTICNGDSVQVGNHWYYNSGTYIDTLQTNLSCDSIITTIVNEIIIDNSITQNANSINAVSGYVNYEWKNCADNSTINGVNTNSFAPTQSGNYLVTITAQNACTAASSCVTVCLPSNTQQSFTICNGDSVQVGNHWYDSSGTYTDTLQTNLGCDSIITTIVNEIIIDNSITQNANSINAVSGYVNYEWKNCADNSIISGANTNNFTPTQSGNYSVTITAQNACTAISNCMMICVSSNTQQNVSICNGDSLLVGSNWYSTSGTYIDSLTSSMACDSIVTTYVNVFVIDTTLTVNNDSIIAQSGYTLYKWKDCVNDSTLQSSSSNVFVAEYNGSFKVTITDLNNCDITSSCVDILTTAIQSENVSKEIMVMPNPAHDEFKLYINTLKQASVKVNIQDVSGRIVIQSSDISTGKYARSYDVSNLSSGIYFIQIEVNDNKLSKKLVIE